MFKDINVRNIVSKYPDCEWISKNCLNWGGLPQRFAIMHPQIGLKFLSTRMSFYKLLNDNNNTTAINTEQFDYLHSKHIGMKTCMVPVDEIPATAARHTNSGEFCFHPGEVAPGCVPTGYTEFVKNHKCKRG